MMGETNNESLKTIQQVSYNSITTLHESGTFINDLQMNDKVTGVISSVIDTNAPPPPPPPPPRKIQYTPV